MIRRQVTNFSKTNLKKIELDKEEELRKIAMVNKNDVRIQIDAELAMLIE